MPIAKMAEALNELDDRHIQNIKPSVETVLSGRRDVEAILKKQQDRLIVIVGPCSLHDVRAGLDYARRLKQYADQAKDDLHIIMRVYFEKPRTTVGWKGLINDPNLDGSYQINKGLRLARGFLLEVANLGIPAGTEFLDTISPQYTADLISWGAIGARTTESQVHRELTSGLSMPVGFKNGTDGSVSIAVDAIKSASSQHAFLSVTKQGISAIVETTGNDQCHVILRGSNQGPNYAPEEIQKVSETLKKGSIEPRIMVDCSHGNSEKKHQNQIKVVESISEQLSKGDDNAWNLFGVMLESHLEEGKQSIPAGGPADLKYGQSITDVEALDKLRAGNNASGAQVNGSYNQMFPPNHGAPGYNDEALKTLGKQSN